MVIGIESGVDREGEIIFLGGKWLTPELSIMSILPRRTKSISQSGGGEVTGVTVGS